MPPIQHLSKSTFNSDLPIDECDASYSSVRKVPSVPVTDHSQRTGKLVSYISSMQHQKMNQRNHIVNNNSNHNNHVLV
ncbi:hypothetical protein A0J61_07457 [Choanephora cucurbitarum]|uniref:Uncharacterized protein n=1 Tax=Choanephora cucurbitarum TaxID=101091 RepID=A0A1C7N5R8_9FUNG|nr:hypothetical protein A0J61_07457 [Choanephora cucurbitarum]